MMSRSTLASEAEGNNIHLILKPAEIGSQTDNNKAEDTLQKRKVRNKKRNIFVDERAFFVPKLTPKTPKKLNSTSQVVKTKTNEKIGNVSRTKEIFIKIVPLEHNYKTMTKKSHVVKTKTNENINNVPGTKKIFIKIVPLEHNYKTLTNKSQVVKTKTHENVPGTKELFIKIVPLEHNYKTLTNKSRVVKTKTHENVPGTKEIFIKIVPLEHHYKTITKKSASEQNTDHKCKNQLLKVTFEPDVEKRNRVHHLRRLEPRNYKDESVIVDGTEEASKQMSPAINLKKNDIVPIYKKLISEESKPQSEDLYEFTDFSPKTKKINAHQRRHNSSIFFDKDTHEILKKLEAKEAKAKRKVTRMKKRLQKPKSYGKIVDDIVSNVMQKIVNNKSSANSKKTANFITRNVDQDTLKTYSPKKIIHINNFQEEMNIIGNCRPEAPTNIKRVVPELLSKQHEAAANTNQVTTRKCIVNSEAQSKNHMNFLGASDIDPILLRSIGSCDNSVSQRDIECCFGFDDALVPPFASSPAPPPRQNPINILSSIVLRPQNESPVDFNIKRPNANSTMIQPNLSPWRLASVNVRHNPHFVSIKGNALPRIDQEVVLDHTFVESYENACSKTSRKQDKTPIKKPAMQQSILDFVDSNCEKENDVLQGSLFDYEAFNSPEKKTKKVGRNRVQEVKRNLGDENHIVSSTPIRRKPLADISNFSEEFKGQEPQNMTYFGFDESTQIPRRKTPEKRKTNTPKEDEENAKPSRFDVNKMKSYAKKARNVTKQVKINDRVQAYEDQNETVSLFEVSNEENVGDVHLFEEPEEMLDNMSPVHIDEKRPRRKRVDSSDSESSVCEKKRRKRKKTQREVEQEAWIQNFNKMCEEIDHHELELV